MASLATSASVVPRGPDRRAVASDRGEAEPRSAGRRLGPSGTSGPRGSKGFRTSCPAGKCTCCSRSPGCPSMCRSSPRAGCTCPRRPPGPAGRRSGRRRRRSDRRPGSSHSTWAGRRAPRTCPSAGTSPAARSTASAAMQVFPHTWGRSTGQPQVLLSRQVMPPQSVFEQHVPVVLMHLAGAPARMHTRSSAAQAHLLVSRLHFWPWTAHSMSLQQSAVGMHLLPQACSLPGQQVPGWMHTPPPQSLSVGGQMQRAVDAHVVPRGRRSCRSCSGCGRCAGRRSRRCRRRSRTRIGRRGSTRSGWSRTCWGCWGRPGGRPGSRSWCRCTPDRRRSGCCSGRSDRGCCARWCRRRRRPGWGPRTGRPG